MKYTTLIFDLDDTLLDTWGQLVQPAARESCQAMIEAGLNADLEECIEKRTDFFINRPREDLFALLIAIIVIHALYVGVIRPSAKVHLERQAAQQAAGEAFLPPTV